MNISSSDADVATLTDMVSATVTDLLPTPTGLQAVSASGTQITVLWTAVSGVSAYDIERDGVVVASVVPGTSFFDTGLTPGTLHEYRVRSVR